MSEDDFREVPKEARVAATFLIAAVRLAGNKTLNLSTTSVKQAVAALFEPGVPGYYNRFDIEEVLHIVRLSRMAEWTNDGVYHLELGIHSAIVFLTKYGLDEEVARKFGQRVVEIVGK